MEPTGNYRCRRAGAIGFEIIGVIVENPRPQVRAWPIAEAGGAGATLATALEVAETAAEGSNILCMLPDTGERYLSTPLFEDVAADMSDEEQALSASTPGCQF